MDLLKENQQWAKAASELAEKVMEQNSQIKKMRDVLRRLRAWDMMDATSDGEYWKKEITIALRADEESEPTCNE